MKLLVFAHPPPPVHGQSVMVQQLLEHLPHVAGFEVRHVDVRLSHDSADIGRVRIGKLITLLGACLRAWRLRVRHGPAYFYYVPAPGKRAALYRDFIALLLCRPFFSGLILHWHAVGLGEWLETRAHPAERWLARRLFGGAALAIVLAPQVADDARRLHPRRLAVVPNGIPDPAVRATVRTAAPDSHCRILYLGLCCRAKGTFDLVSAYAQLTARAPGRFRLTLAGGVASPDDARGLRAELARLPEGSAEWIGFADETRKHALFGAADIFCFPTRYPHEGQPLVLIEALAHDVRIVTTRWRAIPGMLPASHVWYANPGDPAALADALASAARAEPPQGELRRHYLEQFTPERHLAALAAALRSVE